MELPDNEPPDKGVPENNISINELIDMGKRYLLIPLGLLFVEIIYSILTASQDTLSWIQEIVAKIWNNLNLLKLLIFDKFLYLFFKETNN